MIIYLNIVLMWKIMRVLEASVIYIYIYIYESLHGVKNTSECLDPQFQNYQHKRIFKQYMCGLKNISNTQIGKTL